MGENIKAVMVIFVVTAVFSGCGGGTPGLPITSSGNTTGFVTDSPADGVLALRADITTAAFRDSSGHTVAVAGLPRHLELRHLELAPDLLFQTFLPPLTYTSFTLTLENVEIDGISQGRNVQKFTKSTQPALVASNLTATVPINLSVPPETKPGLMIDFDLANSLATDVSGNYVFSPVVHMEPVSAADPAWPLGAACGRIIWISNSPPSITLQLFDSGVTIPLAIDSNTYFSSDLQGMAGLKIGQAVETYARFENGIYTADFIDSAADPTVSKRGIVLGTPTLDGTPLTMLLQN